MHILPDVFYNINIMSVALRLFLAVIFGGVIGLERGATKHPAGFRTHILVCMGAALAMLTNQYIFETITSTADPSRMGAQVITGVGFLGVGTILVTGGQKIRGLTTAAGLWSSACIGLAIGIGFYSGAIIAAVMVFFALTFLKGIESFIYDLSRVTDLYFELESLPELKGFQKFVRSHGMLILSAHHSKTGQISSGSIGVHMSVKLPKGMKRSDAMDLLSSYDGIFLIEEI